MSILVPISGGPDSLYALKKTVESGESVYTLQCHMPTTYYPSSARVWRLIDATLAATLSWFKAVIIKHYDTNVDVFEGHERPMNCITANEYYFIIPQVHLLLAHPDITAIATGVCREEFDDVVDITTNYQYHHDAKTVGSAYKALLNGREVDRHFGLLPGPSKQEIRDYLGEYLCHLSQSCCFPTEDYNNCEKCYKCLIRNATEYRGTSVEYRVVRSKEQ